MNEPFAVAFEEWQRRYRANPQEFANCVEELLGYTPETYGEACSVYFVALLDGLSKGQPWNTIQRTP